MALPNARDQYLRTQVETASKEQLVVMLFDGIVRFTEQARKAIQDNKIEESHHALMRAQAIVMELICTVDKDKGGDIAKNLMGLHAYAFNCLIVCNMKKDLSKIDEVQKIYRQLREGWVGAMDTLGIGANKVAGTPAATAPAPTAAAKSTVPTPPKPVGPAPIPKAPFGGIAAKGPGQSPGNPAGPAAGNGVLASAAKPAAIPAESKPAAAAPAAPKPAVSGYGMGRTAMMGAYGMPAAAPAPAAPVAAAMTTPVVPAAAAPVVKPGMNAKQAAMLNAYQAGTRSIA